jgi:hypothetical protein
LVFVHNVRRAFRKALLQPAENLRRSAASGSCARSHLGRNFPLQRRPSFPWRSVADGKCLR